MTGKPSDGSSLKRTDSPSAATDSLQLLLNVPDHSWPGPVGVHGCSVPVMSRRYYFGAVVPVLQYLQYFYRQNILDYPMSSGTLLNSSLIRTQRIRQMMYISW